MNNPQPPHTNISFGEVRESVWSPTLKLRWAERLVTAKSIYSEMDYTTKVLQQLFISSTGEQKWEDVTTETEDK